MKDWKTILGLVLAAVGIVVTIWVFWYSDAKAHGLRLEVISTAALGGVDKDDDDVKILIHGVEVKDPSVTTLRFLNNGLRPIAATDFDGPMEIGVDSGTSIVRVQLTDATTSELAPKISLSKTGLRLQPLMLNPGDEIDFALTTEGPVKSVFPHVHVAGVSAVELSTQSNPDQNFIRLGLFSAVLFFQWLAGYKAMFGDASETRFYASLSCGVTTLLLQFVAMDAAAASQIELVNFGVTKLAITLVCVSIGLFWAWQALRNVSKSS